MCFEIGTIAVKYRKQRVTLDLSYQHELSEYLTIISKAGFIDGDRNRNYGMNYQRNPLFPVFNGDGTYFKANALDYGNALAMTNERKDVSPNTDGYATLQFNVKLANPLELVLRGNARAGTAGHNFYNPRVYTQGGDLYDGEGGISSSSYKNVTLDGYLTYTNTFAERHAFTAMGGVTYENGTNKTLNTIGRGFANDNLMEENMSGATERFITNGFSETVLASGFTRFNYAFADKYLFTFTARADGSSKFGDNNKWGFFPSGAASWRLSEEAFLKDVEAIDDLKIRASYGISGNQGIAPYQTISKYGQDYYYLNGEEFIIYGLGQQIGREGIGDRYVQWGGMATKDLRWEKTSQFDLGLDASLFHNRLSITLDYYYKKTSDLLRQQFLNPSTGFDRVWTNDGEIENRGFELAVDGRILTSGKLKFDAGLVFSLNRNKVLNIGSQEKSGYVVDKNGLRYEPYGSGIFSDAYLNVLAIGQPVNAFYGYEVDGIIQEMPDNPVKMTRPGEFNYVGLREDGTLDPDMRRIIGDPNPDFTSSLNLQLRHDAGIDFSLMLYAMYGNDVFSTRKLDRISLQKDRWTGENPNNVRPKLRADRQYFASSWFVEDGSFLRIQHVTLGYTFQRIPFLQQARIFLNATNPIVFSNVSEYDPEVGENGRGSAPYPRVAIYTAGLQLKF
ncbi:MAG: SusC/RagA family TonB-linked outer membrane protein [Parapedobacter sp.]|nr:MAG: SusC/RagA family TonB-linked outer membrane protein [Parapedobacter sp.]